MKRGLVEWVGVLCRGVGSTKVGEGGKSADCVEGVMVDCGEEVKVGCGGLELLLVVSKGCDVDEGGSVDCDVEGLVLCVECAQKAERVSRSFCVRANGQDASRQSLRRGMKSVLAHKPVLDVGEVLMFDKRLRRSALFLD